MGIDADELRKLLEEAGIDAEAGVTEQGMPPSGPWMEGVEAVGNLRYATAVFVLERGHWVTHGRALFNMHPDEAIRHFGQQFQKV